MKTTLFFLLAILAGMGYFYGFSARFGKNETTREHGVSRLLIDPAIGFSILYCLYCLTYLCLAATGNASLTIASFITATMIGVGIFMLIWNRAPLVDGISELRHSGRPRSQVLVFLALILSLIVFPQSILGNTPYLVSDTWSHISIVNRLMDTNEIALSSFSMPNDNYLTKYSPHHAFLACAASLTDVSALEIYKFFRYAFPILLVSAFLYFVDKLDSPFLESPVSVACVVVVFTLTFPTTDAIWRGSADYRMPAFILMFVLIGTCYRCYFSDNRLRLSSAISITALSLGIAITHVIEIALVTLMLIPFGLIVALKLRSKSIVCTTAAFLGLFAVSGLVGQKIASYAFAPLNRSIEYSDYVKYYLTQLDTHIVYYTWIAAVLSVCFVVLLNRRAHFNVSLFLIISLFASLLLGPLNPLLFPLYSQIMGSSHSNRIMYAFPFYFALSYALGTATRNLRPSANPSMFALSILCSILVVSATVVHIYKVAGFNGEFTYKRNDALSQLFLYPKFYRAISERYQHRVIVSDTFTSAPINAISNNYIFTHRPWTGGENDRYPKSIVVMNDPISRESRDIICRYDIDVIAINNNPLPEAWSEFQISAPWIKSQFDTLPDRSDISNTTGFDYYTSLDGIDIYDLDRDRLCSK